MLANRFRSSLNSPKSRKKYTIKNKKYIVWEKTILETTSK